MRQPYDPSTVKTFASSSKAGFGKTPDLERGKVPEDWWYFPVVARLHNERTGYPTQKPEALLERIIKASSNPGDLVADFFCGAGTTAVVAQELKRSFITSDIEWRAIHTTRSRLVSESTLPLELLIDSNSQLSYKSISSKGILTLTDESISFDLNSFPDLVYWEVDPNWNRNIFRSTLQAVVPKKKGTIEN